MKKRIISWLLLAAMVLLCTSALAEDAWVCGTCGRTLTSNFCGKCGTQRPITETWTCPKCGAEISVELSFCTECGTERPGPDWYCTKCLALCPGTDSFCTECGAAKPGPDDRYFTLKWNDTINQFPRSGIQFIKLDRKPNSYKVCTNTYRKNFVKNLELYFPDDIAQGEIYESTNSKKNQLISLSLDFEDSSALLDWHLTGKNDYFKLTLTRLDPDGSNPDIYDGVIEGSFDNGENTCFGVFSTTYDFWKEFKPAE